MTADLPDRAADRERTHDLKTWPEHFAAVLDGSKTYEIRVDDRGFRIGDVLRLREWDPIQVPHVTRDYRPRGYTGRKVSRRVTHILAAGTLGLRPGYVALGLAALAARPAPDDGEDGIDAVRRIVTSIPRLTEAEQAAAALDYAETALSETWAALRRIAEGEPDPRRIAADMLEAHGHNVAAPDDGEAPVMDANAHTAKAADNGSITAQTPSSPGSGDALHGRLAEALRQHHPIMRSETGTFSGCRCGHVRLGQDVIAHVIDALLTGPLAGLLADRQALRRVRAAIDRHADNLTATQHAAFRRALDGETA